MDVKRAESRISINILNLCDTEDRVKSSEDGTKNNGKYWIRKPHPDSRMGP